MALRAGYFGLKRENVKKVKDLPAITDIGDGLTLASDGTLTGDAGSVVANPEGSATAGNLTKLKIGENIYNVPDTTYSNATTTTAGLMSADDKVKLNTATTVVTNSPAEPVTEGTLSVTFTEYIIGNFEQIIGTIVSTEDKDASSQSGVALGSVLSHLPIASIVVGDINSSLSAGDRKPISTITISSTGRLQVDGQMVANRSYSFSIDFLFNNANRSANLPESEAEPETKKRTTKKTVKEGE